MFKNYILSAWRNMKRATFYSAISIFCLAVGITGAIVITMYLNHELTYDTHHEYHARIYRMEGIYDVAGASYHMAITPFPLALAMQDEFAQVKAYARFFVNEEETMVRLDDREFLEKGFVLADSTVFDVFTHHFVHGQPQGALSEPNTTVINRSLSEKYFGGQNPVGQSIWIGNQHYLITAVMEDLPENSHFRYQAMLSMASANHDQVYSMNPELFWDININYTYIKLHSGQEMSAVLENMPAFLDKYVNPIGELFDASAEYLATPLRETHFHNIMLAPETGNRSTLLILGLVALFLLVIAAINYTNLATARAAKRAREIGIRKVSGANRIQLITQFFSESLLVAFISLLFSIFLVEIMLPHFNTLTGKSFSILQLLDGGILIQVLVITIITGLAAGAYPAIVLSRMNPSLIVKGLVYKQKTSAILRKGLVVFQFAISIMLVTGTLTVQNQLRFLQNKSLGFHKENRAVVTVYGSGPRSGIETLEQTILQNPLVVGTTKAFSVPGREHNINAVKAEIEGEMRESAISVNYVDHQFVSHMGIALKEGRAFDPEMRTDAYASILVNEAAVRYYGWHDEPIGKQIHLNFDQEGNPQTILQVIGVVEDYHFLSLSNPIEHHMLILPESSSSFRHIIVEYQAGREDQVLPFLEAAASEFDSSRLPEVRSLEMGFSEAFDAEKRLGSIFSFFAMVTIIISLMGLFGLSSFMMEQRKKEIGIRKVLGSSSMSVLGLLYKEFSWLILIAVVVAAPASWLLLERWLQGFVYHIGMSLSPVLLSTLITYVLAIATVSYHSLRSAGMNPVESIRAE